MTTVTARPVRAVLVLLAFGHLVSSCSVAQCATVSASEAARTGQAASPVRHFTVSPAIAGRISSLPLHFEINRGQAEDQVEFLSRGPSHDLLLTANEAVLSTGAGREASRVTLSLAGATAGARIEGVEALPGTVNYFIGNDPAAWRTDIPTYAAVKYHDVYPGVDLVYHGRQGQLEFDFEVAPGADPRRIRLSLRGPGELRVQEGGDLVFGAGAREVRLRKPLVYQDVNGERREVAGRYVLAARGEARFAVGGYDRRLALVIDPILSATYLGGSDNENMANVALDGAGNTFVIGSTTSFNYPVVNAFQSTNNGSGGNGSCFVSKLNPSGSALLYSTYLGGHGDNGCFGGAVDTAGSAYVTGPTSAGDFPVTANAFQTSHAGGAYDAFVARLSPSGNTLLYSTYLGGTGFDAPRGIAANDAGFVWVSGQTGSPNFPVKNAVQPANGGGQCDAFVTKLDTNQAGASSLVFSTYFGGNGADNGVLSGFVGSVDGGLAIDAAGNVVVTGSTSSTDLPTLNPFQPTFGGGNNDAFVLKLGPNGNKVYASYIGGSGDDPGFTTWVDGAGNGYVAGSTSSLNFPLKNAFQGTYGGGSSDGYLVKISPGGQLIYSSFFGGSGQEFPGQVITDRAGNVYITGNTSSNNFPLVAPVQASYGGGAVDAYAMQINPTGTAIGFSTYVGGFGADTGFGVAVDGGGNLVLGVKSDSPNLPVAGPFQGTLRGGLDNYIAKMTLPFGLVAAVLPISRSVQSGGTATIFATIINGGSDVAHGCSISPVSMLPITLLYQTTDPATNALTGTPNTPVDIPSGGFQTFLIAITTNAAFPPADLAFSFGCANRTSATVLTGIDTLLLSASAAPVPDIIALGATPTGDGIVNIPGTTGTGIFAVATSNAGAGGSIKVSADTGGVPLPVNILLCQTSPFGGACFTQPTPTVTTTIGAGETPTFAVFVQGTGAGAVNFNPGVNRLFVRFQDSGNVVRGATSAALQTQP